MGLATPAAIMAGTNVAAQRGILIRDGVALEKSGQITSVIFDKTGTLTQGKLAVAAVDDLRRGSGVLPDPPGGPGPVSREHTDGQDAWPTLARLTASLAQPSNHPLSRAVAKLAELAHPAPGSDSKSRRIQFTDWQELRGKGVQASWNGATLRLGSLNWLRECGVVIAAVSSLPRRDDNIARNLENNPSPVSDSAFVAHWSAQGATILGLAFGTQLIGLFALRDAIKPHAADVVAQLARQGKATYLITGDHKLTAAAIAQQVGIRTADVFAEIPPDQKAEIVKQLQQRGERVAFVGDGINDAPALEQADLGIAVAQASDVAREAADIILLKSDIQAIPEALGLAQATLRTIKQNLFWAFFYNAAAVPLAALGFLSPVICALAMGVSDLIVIGNALRLRRWKE
jgi:Cu+-exporting ATPase